MAVPLKPANLQATAGMEPVITKTIPEPRIVAIPEPVISGEVPSETRVNLPDGEPSQPPHHQEVISVGVRKPSPLVGVVAPAGVEVKPPLRQARVEGPVVEEGVNF